MLKQAIGFIVFSMHDFSVKKSQKDVKQSWFVRKNLKTVKTNNWPHCLFYAWFASSNQRTTAPSLFPLHPLLPSLTMSITLSSTHEQHQRMRSISTSAESAHQQHKLLAASVYQQQQRIKAALAHQHHQPISSISTSAASVNQQHQQ